MPGRAEALGDGLLRSLGPKHYLRRVHPLSGKRRAPRHEESKNSDKEVAQVSGTRMSR